MCSARDDAALPAPGLPIRESADQRLFSAYPRLIAAVHDLLRLPPLRVGPPASGVANSRGVTGGVYKTRERIHRDIADPRLLATPPSCRRVSACNPNRDRL